MRSRLGITVGDFAVGKKVFFITPDTIIFPESNLLDYFSLGYECYFVENDKQSSLSDRIIRIITAFNDCVLFFNVDAVIQGINWVEFISELQRTYGDKITIGVLFVKRQEKKFKSAMEIVFNNRIGIKGGCIQLEYQKKDNFAIIQNRLAELQVKGRRKNIRGLCNNKYTYSFMKEGLNYTGYIQDLSLSHFSFASTNYTLQMKTGEKLDDFTLFLNGLIIRTPVSLLMERAFPNFVLYVFAFCDLYGNVGLSERYKTPLTENLYKLNCDNLKSVMDAVNSQFDKGITNSEEIGKLDLSKEESE